MESTISTPEPLAAAPEPLYLTADYPDPADSPVADPDLVSNLEPWRKTQLSISLATTTCPYMGDT